MGIDKSNIPSTKFTIDLHPGSIKGAMQTAEAKGSDLWMVPLDALRVVEDLNVRIRVTDDYQAELGELADSIDANGFYKDKPLAGFVQKEGDENVIIVTDGHRRREAVALLNERRAAAGEGAPPPIDRLPVVVTTADSKEDITIGLVTRNSGRPLTPFELAIVVQRLQNYGMPVNEIARRLGKTERYVNDLLVLVKAPKPVRDFVIEGNVSATEAIKQLRKDKDKAAETIAKAVKRSGGKKRVTAKAISNAPRFKTVRHEVGFGEGDKLDAILAAVRTFMRDNLGITDGAMDGDGKLALALQVPDESKPAPAEKPAAKPKASKPASKAKAKAKPEPTGEPVTAPTLGHDNVGEGSEATSDPAALASDPEVADL